MIRITNERKEILSVIAGKYDDLEQVKAAFENN